MIYIFDSGDVLTDREIYISNSCLEQRSEINRARPPIVLITNTLATERRFITTMISGGDNV